MTTELPVKLDDPKIIQAMKATVAQNLTDAEFVLFSELCRSTRLNPFKKEIWAIKAGGRLQLMTGINGFLAIANNHPQFDGLEVEVDDDMKPTKATCRVWRKDRKFPSTGIALMSEYRKDTPIWKSMPRVMLTKVAKSIALREAFPQEMNGLYTDDEMPPEFRKPDVDIQTPRQESRMSPGEHEIVERSDDAPCYAYDLAKIPDEKRRADAEMWVRSQRDIMPDETRPGVWIAASRLKKLAAYEVEA